MTTTKVRRVRVCTRLSVPLRARLAKYCAASGLSERTVIEDALRKHLDGTGDTALLLRRFDKLEDTLARDHRCVELLSEAFGRYLRQWFAAHGPNTAQGAKPMTVAEARYQQFVQRLGERFAQGHRFTDDMPVKEPEAQGEPPDL